MRRLLWIALLAAGCNSGHLGANNIELTIAVDATVSDGDLMSIKALDIAAVGDASASMTYPLSRPFSRNERLIVHFPKATGNVQVSGLARDAQSLVVARGVTGKIDLAGSDDAHVAVITLTEPATGAHAPTGIALAPSSFTLFTNQTLALGTGNEAVTWAANDGGAIDDTGTFTAPATAGTFHAVATSVLYPTDHGTVTLNVLASGIALFAGTLGGSGTVDGTGSQARINSSRGMVLDGNTLYFSDNGQTIRRADTTTGAVTTLAGQPDHALSADGTGSAAGFVGPMAIAYDGAGKLYVAEAFCPCIRVVDVATGQTTTLAGQAGMNGTMDGTGAAAQFRFPQALAYDPATHLLYVGEDQAQTIRTVDVSNGVVVTIAGTVNTPGGVDGAALNATFNNPWSLVLDGNALFIYDQRNNEIRKLDLGSKMVSTIAHGISASTLALYQSGTLILGSPFRLVDEASGALTDINGVNGDNDYYQYADALVAAPDGTFWTGTPVTLQRYTPTTSGSMITASTTWLAGFDYQWDEQTGPRAATKLGSLNSFVVRSDGTIYGRDNRIIAIDGSGNITSVAGSPSGPLMSGDGDMAFGSDGMLYAPDRYNGIIVRIDVDHGGTVTTYAGKSGTLGSADGPAASATFNGPDGIAADGHMLYITDQQNDTIRAIDLSTNMVSTLAGSPGMCGNVDMPGAMARFCGPDGLAADGSGNLYVADNNSIRKIVIATGAVSPAVANNGLGFVDGASGTAKLWGPFRLTFDAQKKFLYFSEQGNDAIRRVEIATGLVSTVAGGPGKAEVIEGAILPGSINQPGAVHFAATGELLVGVPRENALVQIRLP